MPGPAVVGGSRMAYVTPRRSRPRTGGEGKGRVGADDHGAPLSLAPVNDREQELVPSVALWTLPGRSFAARQSPV